MASEIRCESLGIFCCVIANALYCLRRLTAGNSHHFHQLGRHFSRNLILNATGSVRVGLEKNHDLFLSNACLLQAVQKLTVTDPASQLLNSCHQLLTVAAHSRPKPSPLSTLGTPQHQ